MASRLQNPPNVPTSVSDRNDLGLYPNKRYTNEAGRRENFDELAKRIILKTKELDEKVVTKMMLGVRGKLLKMYKKRVYNII